MTDTFTGFHGTNDIDADAILSSEFVPSTGMNEWLGDGVYFFIGDTFCPIENAKNWANASAWDNINRCYKYNEYAILKAEIKPDRTLDLREPADLRDYTHFKTEFTKKYRKEVAGCTEYYDLDTYIFNAFSKLFTIDALICNFYIQNRAQRRSKEESRIPNSTVLCVRKIDNIVCVEKHITGKIKI